jgi:hypothetical protein
LSPETQAAKGNTMTTTIEHEWEIELPGATAEQLLAALNLRDRLFGQTLTLEPDDAPKETVEVWLGTAEVLREKVFHLGIFAELAGPKKHLEGAQDLIEDLVGEQVEEAASEAAEAKVIARRPAAEIEFRKVSEEEEQPNLIIPEWLAPEEELDLPWSFRSFEKAGKAWPDEKLLKKHDRIALVPSKKELLLYALPALKDEE